MKIIKLILKFLLCLISLFLSACLVCVLMLNNSEPSVVETVKSPNLAVLDRFDMQMTNTISSALDGVLSIKKVYWLSDNDQVAPVPDPARFGTSDDPASLGWLLEEAAELLDGQEMYFSTETEIIPGTIINYYLDDTILAITWKEEINMISYTISEVKIAHPSQFRRFLAGGEYGSSIQLTTSEMASSVNAVVASSGDFYKFRTSGIITYDGIVRKMEGRGYDTCFIDENGDMQFVYAGEITNMEAAQQYVTDNNIRFSLGFGPALIENGEALDVKSWYPIGEMEGHYARAGLGQMDDLHYVFVVGNAEVYGKLPTVYDHMDAGMQMGCEKFYNLDGGQTAVIYTNNKVINRVVYGYQRQISDIIYFATALPDGTQ